MRPRRSVVCTYLQPFQRGRSLLSHEVLTFCIMKSVMYLMNYGRCRECTDQTSAGSRIEPRGSVQGRLEPQAHSVFSPTAHRAVQRAGRQLQRGQHQLQPAWLEWGTGLGRGGWAGRLTGWKEGTQAGGSIGVLPGTPGLPPAHLCSDGFHGCSTNRLPSHPAILL